MIQNIINQFFPNIEIILLMVGFLLLSLGAKIGSGIYLNVLSLEKEFDWKRLGMGVLKGLIFVASIFGVSLVLCGMPIVLAEAEVLFVDNAQAYSASLPLLVLAPAIYKYIKEAYENYKKTLNITDEDIQATVKTNIVG